MRTGRPRRHTGSPSSGLPELHITGTIGPRLPGPDVRPPKKRTIAPAADVGSHAPAAEQAGSAKTHHAYAVCSAYEGKWITGRAEPVLPCGEVISGARKLTRRAGRVTYTPQATCQYLD
ncbi:hypothetical protein [Streptomyces sp. NBC_00046]|uniref:hypothetical protein n=1 Tax=unclassified Streptomyces TaxID=2593676 RepID=UPI00324F84F2